MEGELSHLEQQNVSHSEPWKCRPKYTLFTDKCAHMNEHLPANSQEHTSDVHAGCREILWIVGVVGVDISVVMKGAAVGFY